jgi:hypothetical protein
MKEIAKIGPPVKIESSIHRNIFVKTSQAAESLGKREIVKFTSTESR